MSPTIKTPAKIAVKKSARKVPSRIGHKVPAKIAKVSARRIPAEFARRIRAKQGQKRPNNRGGDSSFLLKNSLVNRSGITARQWHAETRKVFADLSSSETINFKFSIDAAGGGKTEVQIELGYADVEKVLANVAKLYPEKLEMLLNVALKCARASRDLVEEVEWDADYWQLEYWNKQG